MGGEAHGPTVGETMTAAKLLRLTGALITDPEALSDLADIAERLAEFRMENESYLDEMVDLERRAKKAEEQFDELSVIHNRVRQERDELVGIYRELAEMWHKRAVFAGKVLWALRPVLRAIYGNAPRQAHFANFDLADAFDKLPWLKEWLNDD